VAVMGLAAVLNWSLATTFVYAVVALAFLALTLNYPRAAATVLVLVAWGLVVPTLLPPVGGQVLVPWLLTLAIPVAVAAHLIRWVPPWVTTLAALLPALVVAVSLVSWSSTGAFWGAAGAAAAVLVYRFVLARRVRADLAQQRHGEMPAQQGSGQ